MIPKLEILQRLTSVGLVAVVRAENGEQAIRICEALLEGGCAALEVTFTVPRAHRVIELLAERFKPSEMILGAGTVLDPETARIAILSGATYVVSPSLNPETVRLCNRYQIPMMPGAMTIREVIEGMEAGADIIKLFPGEAFGPNFIKSIKGPFPQAPLMPTGGVDVSNVAQWIEAGAVAVGAGSSLIGGAKTGDYGQITRTAREFIEKIQEAREAQFHKK
ncbi:2-keto-3-deoxy-phosphogluconate aldolase [Abditibacterium utsteinense]|uniref:2-keto-3-deoxy-phosphogluconate aldolase n=1 Tax=Abditibacterium utsteinense TaxID=1960156 RepID=A0A2S8SR54_9BACT|nr:bifunctional 2-keto-4-hydroxyglutarate aldolase/2-keto-3-deoxy-6-phosphogluconate aldolase [Abditibacterium utsteinense]PQV63277.1 2-keto-3-deoxy-phosphogluconate aldolase [Abditibacterium utsteinense]